MEKYVSQLKTSGSGRKQAREAVICGVLGWRRKLERREKAGQKQYLEASETLEKRTEDKLLEKTSWYKVDNKRKVENQESKFLFEEDRVPDLTEALIIANMITKIVFI